MAKEDMQRHRNVNDLLQRCHQNQNVGMHLFNALQKEVATLEETCRKLKTIADENAVAALYLHKRCRQYKRENHVLKEQVAQLQSMREQPHSGDSMPPSSTQGVAQGKLSGSADEDNCTTSSAKSSKLSTNKHRKKVRYQELPAQDSTGQSVHTSGSEMVGRIQHSGTENRNGCHESMMDHVTCQVTSHQSISPQPDLISAVGKSCVHVPETEMFTLDDSGGGDVSSEDKNKDTDLGMIQSLPQGMSITSGKRGSRGGNFRSRVRSVPETQQTDSLMLSPIPVALEDQDLTLDIPQVNTAVGECRRPPTQSTPVQHCINKNTSRKSLVAGILASPLLAKSRPSNDGNIPPSESQLSVDFSATQMSPTFCRGERISTPDQQTQGDFKPAVNSLPSKHRTSTPQHSTSGATDIMPRSSVKTPGCDDSGQSEASFLILHPTPTRRAVSQTSNSKTVFSPIAADHQVGARFTAADNRGSRKRKLQTGETERVINAQELVFTECDEQCKQSNLSGGLDLRRELTGAIALERRTFSLYQGKTSRNRGINVKVKSPEKYVESDFPLEQQQVDKTSLESSKPSLSRSKSLIQAKLTADSFKPVTSPCGEQQKKYNGGKQVFVDSQNDPYIQQAIQESLLLAEHKNRIGMQGGISTDFKVPVVPKSKFRGNRNNASPSLLLHGVRQSHVKHRITRDKLNDPSTAKFDGACESDSIVLMQGAFNGSIDPAVELDFSDEDDSDEVAIEKRSRLPDECVDGTDIQKNNASGDNGDVTDVVGQAEECHDPVDDMPQFVDDSIVDMFDDGDDDPENGDRLQEPAGGIGGKSLGSRGIKLDEDLNGRNANRSSFVEQFDSIPKTDAAPAYKYKDVVRKRDERQKLRGFDCKECAEYYAGLGLTTEEIALRTKNCSRHRGHYSPPSTPDHYWSIDFPNTETCLERGYIKEIVEERPRKKRKMKYRQYFTAAREDDKPSS